MSSRPVVFLDLLGTVSIGADIRNQLFVATDRCVRALARLYKSRPTLRFIITSDARFDDLTISRLGGYFRNAGIPRDAIAGVTSHLGKRGDEIAAWLAANPDVTRYVIFDDSEVRRSDGAEVERVIYVSPTQGITDGAVAIAIGMLDTELQPSLVNASTTSSCE